MILSEDGELSRASKSTHRFFLISTERSSPTFRLEDQIWVPFGGVRQSFLTLYPVVGHYDGGSNGDDNAWMLRDLEGKDDTVTEAGGNRRQEYLRVETVRKEL